MVRTLLDGWREQAGGAPEALLWRILDEPQSNSSVSAARHLLLRDLERGLRRAAGNGLSDAGAGSGPADRLHVAS
jgi:hypothetical protein